MLLFKKCVHIIAAIPDQELDLARTEIFVKQDHGFSEKTFYFLYERKVRNYHTSPK